MAQLLTIRDTAQRLGVGPRTVYSLCQHDPTFPVIKLNAHCYRVVAEALDAWLLAQAQHRPAPEWLS